jgi:hypothetical protein
LTDTCYHRVDVDVANSLAIDLKDYILTDPYRPDEHAIYIPEAGGIWTLDPSTLFTQEFIDYAEHDVGFRLDIAQIFMRKPGYQHPGAHIDISKDHTVHGGGINWTLDPDDAQMVWYEYPNTKPVVTERSPTDINWEWPLEGLTECARHTIGQTPALVRTDLPHTVHMGNCERWLISLRTLDAKTWLEHLELFKDRIQ